MGLSFSCRVAPGYKSLSLTLYKERVACLTGTTTEFGRAQSAKRGPRTDLLTSKFTSISDSLIIGLSIDITFSSRNGMGIPSNSLRSLLSKYLAHPISSVPLDSYPKFLFA